jgi:glycosyltransferase involved in cell wall biosynthesis
MSSDVRSVALPFSSSVGTLAILRNLNRQHIAWLAEHFVSERADAVVIVHGAIDLGLRGTMASRQLGLRTISYLPMSFPRRTMGLHGGWFFDRYFALQYRLFDAFLTISDAQQELIRAFAPGGTPVEVLENCIASETPPAFDVPTVAGPLRIGVVGRLEWRQKGLSHLLDIAQQVLKRRANVRFVVIGDGPDRNRLEHGIRDRGLGAHFECLGWLGDRERIYSSFDLLLIPSMFEGVPLVLLEALVRQRPTLARVTPGTRVFVEYLPDRCLYRDTGEAVQKLCNADDLIAQFRGMADQMSRQVLERHGRDHFASRVKQIFAQWMDTGYSR